MKFKSFLTAIAVASLIVATSVEAGGGKFSGRAFVAKISLLGITTTIVDTGPLPGSGGNITKSLPDINLLGITAELLKAHTEGGGNVAKSFAELINLVANIDLALLPLPLPLPSVLDILDISASVVRANSRARCVVNSNGVLVPTVNGNSHIADLVILGAPINVTGEPNQTINLLGLVKVVINEQKQSFVSGRRAITVNALHVTVTPPLLGTIADIIVSSAHSDIKCSYG